MDNITLKTAMPNQLYNITKTKEYQIWHLESKWLLIVSANPKTTQDRKHKSTLVITVLYLPNLTLVRSPKMKYKKKIKKNLMSNKI